jgi:hypothetical protein
MLRLARRHETPGTFIVSNEVCRVYRTGEFPLSWVEECPVHRNSILADGYCDECGLIWKNISEEERVMIRVGIDAGLLKPDVIASGAKPHHPKLKLIYNELKEDGKLPILRKRISRGGNSDPFFVHKQH